MEWNKHIKRFERYEDQEDESEELFNYPYRDDWDGEDEEDDSYGDPSDDESDEMQQAFDHLASTLRQMIRQSGFKNFSVSNHNKDFVIEFNLEKEMQFSNFVKICDLMKKIHYDILMEYEPIVDLWYTKDKRPLLTYDFYYKEGKKAPKKIFDDDPFADFY